MRYIRYRGNDLLWALYGLEVCACLALYALAAAPRLGITGFWAAPALAVPGLLLSLLIFFLLRAASAAVCRAAYCRAPVPCDTCGPGTAASGSAKKEKEGQKIRLWEYLFLFAVLAAAAALRIVFLSQTRIVTILPAWIGTAFWLRTAFQLAALALLYPALRILAGRTAAVYVSAAAALLPALVRGTADGEGSLWLLLSALYLLQTALLLKVLGSGERKAWPFVLLFGLFSGAALCDAVFAVFPVLSLWGILCQDNGESRQEKIRAFCLYLGAAVSGFGAMLAVQVLVFHRLPGEFFDVWLSGFFPLSLNPAPAVLEGEGWTLLPVLLPACLYIFGFHRQRENRGVLWLPSFLLMTAVILFGKTGTGGRTVAWLLWLVMAGMGLHSACCVEPSEGENGRAAGKDAGSEACMEEDAVPGAKGEAFPRLRPGEQIPNPLPVPRRRVSGPMDYAFEPEEKEMHFDLEPAENDDFEIH